VVRRADVVTPYNRPHAGNVPQAFSQPSPEKFEVVHNGFDEEDCANVESDARAPDGRFVLVHTGTVDTIRDPGSFLTALSELRKERRELRGPFRW